MGDDARATASKLCIIPGMRVPRGGPRKSVDVAGCSLARGRFGTNRRTMLRMGDDAARVVMRQRRT